MGFSRRSRTNARAWQRPHPSLLRFNQRKLAWNTGLFRAPERTRGRCCTRSNPTQSGGGQSGRDSKGGGASRRFGHTDRRDAHAVGQDPFECGLQPLGDVPGDVFRRGVHLVKRFGFIEVGGVESLCDCFEGGLDGVKVAEHAVGVERLADDRGGDVPVVPVQWLTRAPDDEGVGGGESGLDSEFIHGRV